MPPPGHGLIATRLIGEAMTHNELKSLFLCQAEAIAGRKDVLAKMKVALFIRLANTVSSVSYGKLNELAELKRLAPAIFNRFVSQVGTTSFMPRHALEFVAGMIHRLKPHEGDSNMYLPRSYREVLER
jgi:hypothetical protein